VAKKIFIVIGVIALLILAVLITAAVTSAAGYGVSVGQLYFLDEQVFLVNESKNSSMIVSDQSKNGGMFSDYSNGDKIVLIHDGVEESLPARTGGYFAVRISGGDGSYKPSDDAIGIVRVSDLEEFSFSLTWNTYGVSSYDSETGRLVKTTDATNPDDYVTYHRLTEQEKEQVYALIKSLDIQSYPDVYDPHNGGLASTPSMTLILSVKTDSFEKTVTAENISLGYEAKNKKGQKFLEVCRDIREILIETDEWKALPEYEFFYD